MVQKQLYDKSHLLLSYNEPSTLVIDGSSIETITKEVLLGITIDKDLKFDEHVNSLCKKTCQKLNEDNHESIHRVSIWVLSLSLDVP